MIDAVLSYHLNPFTCGVAKFNRQLAKRLGVPCMGLGSDCQHPLVSIKPSEIPELTRLFGRVVRYDLLLHDRTLQPWSPVVTTARRVFYADEIGCPSTLEGNPWRGETNVLLFGMSHKIDRHADHLERLRDLLLAHGRDYTVSVSTAVHEGDPWDGAFVRTVGRLREMFGDHLRVLGYLADDALAREFRLCHAVALFFDPAVRLNNTSIWGALEARCAVVTNLDEHSPPDLIHNETVFDIKRMTTWPAGDLRLDVANAGAWAASAHGWDKLITTLHA